MQSRNFGTPRTASRQLLLVDLVASPECLLLGLTDLSDSSDLLAGFDMIKFRKSGYTEDMEKSLFRGFIWATWRWRIYNTLTIMMALSQLLPGGGIRLRLYHHYNLILMRR